MKANIKLLEERVAHVVERLNATTEERDRLREQIASLERQGHVPAPRWSARLGEIEQTLEESVRELRGQ